MFKDIFTEADVNTSDFEATHSKKPKGKGNWAFAFSKDARGDDIFFVSGSYSVAKKEALKRAREQKQFTIYVLG